MKKTAMGMLVFVAVFFFASSVYAFSYLSVNSWGGYVLSSSGLFNPPQEEYGAIYVLSGNVTPGGTYNSSSVAGSVTTNPNISNSSMWSGIPQILGSGELNLPPGYYTLLEGYESNVGYMYSAGQATFTWVYWDGVNVIDEGSGVTQILTVNPYDGDTIATSSSVSIGASGILDSSDLSSSTVLDLKFYNNANQLTQCADVICSLFSGTAQSTDIQIPLTSSGPFNLSTSTSILNEGQYTMTTSIENPQTFLGFVTNSGVVTSTSTEFVAATTTFVDNFVNQVTQQTNEALYGVSNATSSSCAILSGSFDLAQCLLVIFIPNMSQVSQNYQATLTTAEGVFPFSYLTGMVAVWQSLQASSTENSPTYDINLNALNIGSTTSIGNVFPDINAFSSSTVERYIPAGFLDDFKGLASVAIILGLFANIFFTVRNIISV